MHISIHFVESIEVQDPQEGEGDIKALWRTIVITDDRGVKTEISLFADDLSKLDITG